MDFPIGFFFFFFFVFSALAAHRKKLRHQRERAKGDQVRFRENCEILQISLELSKLKNSTFWLCSQFVNFVPSQESGGVVSMQRAV